MKNDSKETQTQHTLSVYFCGQEDCGPNHSSARPCAHTTFST